MDALWKLPNAASEAASANNKLRAKRASFNRLSASAGGRQRVHGQHSLATPEQQPCRRNTCNQDENVPDLTKQNFREDYLPQDQDCAEGETECRPSKWARGGSEWRYQQT